MAKRKRARKRTSATARASRAGDDERAEARWLADVSARPVPPGYRIEVVPPGMAWLRPDQPYTSSATGQYHSLLELLIARIRRNGPVPPDEYRVWFEKISAVRSQLLPSQIRRCKGCEQPIEGAGGALLLTLEEERAADSFGGQWPGFEQRDRRHDRREFCSEACRDAYKKRRRRDADPTHKERRKDPPSGR